jgi:hypothetical protein
MSEALPNIRVSTVTGLDGVDVVVGGEIDLETWPILEVVLAAAVERSSHDVRVDIGEVAFLDSSGIRFLETFHDRLLRCGAASSSPTPARRPLECWLCRAWQRSSASTPPQLATSADAVIGRAS